MSNPSNPYVLPPNQPARDTRPAPSKILVDTTSGDHSTASYFEVEEATRDKFTHLTNRIEQGMSVRFIAEGGAHVYVPYHSIASIVYVEGAEQ